jgi:DNA-binding NtrC family response regulator
MNSPSKHPILVVDDEPEILFSLRALLRRDFDVHTAESGHEALDILNQQPIDVIMTDQRMPEMTGVELLKHARGECPQAIRIVFTGYADIKSVVGAINEGSVFRYITKPWDPDELRQVLLDAALEHDLMVERQRLLGDLSSHLQASLALTNALRSGKHGTLTTAAQAEMTNLEDQTTRLLSRMDALAQADQKAKGGGGRRS